VLTYFYHPLPFLAALVGLIGAGHALLHKRDPRAAFGWIAVCLMFPLLGTLVYFVFGINRVQTRAKRLTRAYPFELAQGGGDSEARVPARVVKPSNLAPRWQSLARLSEGAGSRPLLEGNTFDALHGGERAYPAMLQAIADASERVWLSTYIFETGPTGRAFVDALVDAHRRGVDVRVLIDGVGELYDWPWAGTLLRRGGVRVARFMRPTLWPPTLNINLRNHRKMLVIDGREAFVGGMNIGDRHVPQHEGVHERVVDVHFRTRGPIVTHVATIFAEDWQFVTSESLRPEVPGEVSAGDGVIARAFSDGPNEDMGRMTTVLIGAINAATERIDIMTPYFLPPTDLQSALQSACLRGVRVRVLLPGRNNLAYVHWATQHLIGDLVRYGVEIWFQRPPFVHSKLFIVDGYYALVGSANIDPRSLRLNFELGVEVFDEAFAAALADHCDRAARDAVRVTPERLDERSLAVRLRDGFCWLFSPYL